MSMNEKFTNPKGRTIHFATSRFILQVNLTFLSDTSTTCQMSDWFFCVPQAVGESVPFNLSEPIRKIETQKESTVDKDMHSSAEEYSENIIGICIGIGVLDTGVSLYVQVICSFRSLLCYSSWLQRLVNNGTAVTFKVELPFMFL